MRTILLTRFRMIQRCFVLAALVAGSLLPSARAVDAVYENFGTVTNTPQIDAVSFINHGEFDVSSTLAYETRNTLFFVNSGVMSGFPGFRFSYAPPQGPRLLASSFVNGLGARISGTGFTFGGGFFGGGGIFGTGFENPQIIIAATNVLNQGDIRVDSGGLVHIEGKTVNLTRSAVGIQPIFGGVGFLTPTNFVPDVGILDLYWGMDNSGQAGIVPSTLISKALATNFFRVSTPQHQVTNAPFRGGFGGPPQGARVALQLTNAMGFVLTNAVTPTNLLVQAVFVQGSDTNLSFDVRFAPSTIFTNPLKTAVLEISTLQTNVLDAGNFKTTVYLIDRIASETNFVVLTNLNTIAVAGQETFMPSTYEVTRVTPLEWVSGSKSNQDAVFMLDSKLYTNGPVPYNYAAYRFLVTNLSATLPAVPDASITNIAGRVEIFADDLILDRTRIRAEGFANIKANNLISSSNAIVDVQNLSVNLSTKTPELKVKSVVKESLQRLAGPVSAWSGVWTNTSAYATTNITADPNDPTIMTTNVSNIDVTFHVLVVRADALLTKLPVYVHDFKATGPSVTISDTLRIQNTVLVDAESLTVETNSLISLPSGNDWNSIEFPKLKILTNNGTILIPSTGHFGDDRSFPYVSIANHNSLNAFDFVFKTSLFENTGSIVAGPATFGPPNLGATITLQADQVFLTGGGMTAGGSINISAQDVKMLNSTNSAGGALFLSIVNSIGDGGAGGSNQFTSSGIHLLAKPRFGDFLGTTFISVAPNFELVPHTWAAEDRGASAGGFQDNAAIGKLVLKGGIDTIHSFHGATGNNAMYVDFLDFEGTAQDVANAIDIQPGLVIYFADSNLPVEQLNGMFNGRLVWVSGFAGPNSSVDVVLRSENRTIQVNRALRESPTIDSDGDGIANGLDAFPFDPDTGGFRLRAEQITNPAPGIAVSWDAAPLTTYQVEYTSSLATGNWQLLSRYTNTASSPKRAAVQDALSPTSGQRYYRVRTAPR